MSPEIEQARHEIAATRAQIDATANELKETISRRVHRAKEAVSPAHYAREFPWAALGLALGAGLAIGLIGADAKVTNAAVDGAKAAGSKVGEGAVAVKDAVVEKFAGDDGSQGVPSTTEARAPADAHEGMHTPAMSAIHELLDDGLEEILGALGVSRHEVKRRLSS
jgi:hypothetical protein